MKNLFFILVIFLVVGCSKELEEPNLVIATIQVDDNYTNFTTPPMYNPLKTDENFKEIVRLTVLDNELGISLAEGKITLEQFNEIVAHLSISENSWMPNFTNLENFDSELFFEYLEQNYGDINLHDYFMQLFYLTESFYYSNYLFLSGLNESERIEIFIDAFRTITEIEVGLIQLENRNGDSDPCHWCNVSYDTCTENAWINAGGVFGAAYTTAATMILFSGGVVTAPAGFVLVGGFFGGVFTAGAGYWTCTNELMDCRRMNSCGSGGGGIPPSGGIDWWGKIPNKL